MIVITLHFMCSQPCSLAHKCQ